MSEVNYPNARDCEHGRLRRKCPYCEHIEDMKDAEKQISELCDRNNTLTEILASIVSLLPEDVTEESGEPTTDQARLKDALNLAKEVLKQDASELPI